MLWSLSKTIHSFSFLSFMYNESISGLGTRKRRSVGRFVRDTRGEANGHMDTTMEGLRRAFQTFKDTSKQ